MSKKQTFPQVWRTIKFKSDVIGRKYSDEVMYSYDTTINSEKELNKFFEDAPHESCYELRRYTRFK